MKKRFSIAIIIIISLVWAAESIVQRFLPTVPPATKVPRNFYRFRGWSEYVAVTNQPTNTARLVIITNSQGYAGEERDAEKIYTRELAKILNQNPPHGFAKWEVLNLSADGMTSIEYMILATYLQQYQPTLVLAVTGFADYRSEHSDAGFSFCRSDIPRLSTRWSVAAALPASYWWRHGKSEDVLSAFFAEHFALCRFGDYFWSLMDAYFPGAQRLFYSASMNYHPWELSGYNALLPGANVPGGPAEAPITITYDDKSRRLLKEYLTQLNKLSAPVVVVAQPVRLSLGKSQRRRAVQQNEFIADLEKLTPQLGLSFTNMSQALPAEGFMTSSHLYQCNHQKFAALLADYISHYPIK